MNAAHALYQDRYRSLENTPRAQALLRCVPRKGRVAWAKLDIPQLIERKFEQPEVLTSTPSLPSNQGSRHTQTLVQELLADAQALVKGGIEAGIFATCFAVFLGSLWMIG